MIWKLFFFQNSALTCGWSGLACNLKILACKFLHKPNFLASKFRTLKKQPKQTEKLCFKNYKWDKNVAQLFRYWETRKQFSGQCIRPLVLCWEAWSNVKTQSCRRTHLCVERKVVYVDGTRAAEDCRRNPQYWAVMFYDGHCVPMFFQPRVGANTINYHTLLIITHYYHTHSTSTNNNINFLAFSTIDKPKKWAFLKHLHCHMWKR